MINIEVSRYNSGELTEAEAHLSRVKEIVGEKPVLMIVDRGYESIKFLDVLEKAGVKYLIRIKKGSYKAELSGMQGADCEVELFYTPQRLSGLKLTAPERAKELKARKSVKTRILRTAVDTPDQMVWMTNLTEGSGEEIQELYRKRWTVEEKYHTLKNKMKFESVTGNASIYVEQDFYAQILVFNVLHDLIRGAQRRVEKKAHSKKYRYSVRVNENMAIGLLKEQFIGLLIEEDDRKRRELSEKLKADMEKYIVPVRTLKGTPRKPLLSNKYQCNQKPTF